MAAAFILLWQRSMFIYTVCSRNPAIWIDPWRGLVRGAAAIPFTTCLALSLAVARKELLPHPRYLGGVEDALARLSAHVCERYCSNTDLRAQSHHPFARRGLQNQGCERGMREFSTIWSKCFEQCESREMVSLTGTKISQAPWGPETNPVALNENHQL